MRVGHAGVYERRQEDKVVIDAVVPIKGRMSGAETFGGVAGRRGAGQHGIVIEQEAVPGCAEHLT